MPPDQPLTAAEVPRRAGQPPSTIAAYFVEQQAEEDVASRLDQIMERLDRIEAGLRPGEDQHAREHQRH
jgi:hypothetical protein